MQILDLDATWSESEPRTPLVCILSIGSDPTSQIATLAKNKNIRMYKLQITRLHKECIVCKLVADC